jgi:hypothetical protein
MEIMPAYEVFGRELEFEHINNIRTVYQPGILSKETLFNSAALRKALKEHCWRFSRDEVLVYFRNIAGGMLPQYRARKGNWWDSFQEFASRLGEDFPAGMQVEYWYGDGGSNNRASPEFKKCSPPYQAFVRLFDNALQGFSCFVGGSQEGISFSSNRTNYDTIKPGEGLIHDQKTLWKGTPDAFLNSAYRVEDALERMNMTHNTGVSGHNYKRAEVRIITRYGALVSSLVDDSSATLLVDHSSLEKIVENWVDRQALLLGKHRMIS